MELEILTPEKKLFSGNVYGVQLPGINGSFEVLDKHAAMVSALGTGTLKVLHDKAGTKTESFTISGGIIEVLRNNISVLVEKAQIKEA
jgi:F-type H+-transporting ATPase subunit epsilon